MFGNEIETRYRLGLAFLPSFGPVRLRRLLAAFENSEQLWHTTESELLERGFSVPVVKRFCAERDATNLEKCVERCAKAQCVFLTEHDARFPHLLKEIPDAPLGIFVRGTLEQPALSLAVVGTRRPSSYGIQATKLLAGELTDNGVVVISGLALGIDGIAHQSTLEHGGTTIAVLAAGLDQIFPSSHYRLAQTIVERHGALISEYAPGAPALKHHFPLRNRIIAGMTSGTVVTEAPVSSGALLTAELALQYDRDVFAVPGPITNGTHAGTNKLLRRGAQVVTCTDDILSAYHRTATMHAKTTRAPLTGTEQTVLKLFAEEAATVDQLVKISTLEASVVNASLTLLVVKGWIVQLDALHYQKI